MPDELPLYVTYGELEQISKGVQETHGNYQKINLGIKYFRDITQGEETASWSCPQVDVIGLTDKDIWEIATFIKKDEEDYEWDDTTMVEFSVKDMLALEQIRVRVLERQYGVRWVGVATIKGKSDESGYPYMYDHKRCRALKKHKKYPAKGPNLPEWQWLIVRSDMKRFRIRTSYNNSKSTFRCDEYPFWGPPPETMGPPSTGPGHDSKHKKDGVGYFKRLYEKHFPDEANHRGSGGDDQQDPQAMGIMD